MSEAGARHLIEPHLWAGEEVLWCDQPLAAGPVAWHAGRKGFYGAVGTAATVLVFALFIRGPFRDLEPATDRKIQIAGFVAAALILAFGAISAWSRARRLAHLVAYAVSNRRIIMVQNDEVQWVGARELESVRLIGSNLVVTRGRTETEQLWAEQVQRRTVASAELVAREVVLAALPEPQRVLSLVQTLQHPTAS